MAKDTSSNMVAVFTSLLGGLASFFVSGILASLMITGNDNYILGTIIAGVIGSLLLGLLLHMRNEIFRMTLAGLIGMPVALLLSFLVVEGIGSLLPSLGASFENTNIPDIGAITLMGVLFGGILGAATYGRKAMWLFAVICGLVSSPFGFLVAAMNAGHGIKAWLENVFALFGKIDLNFLAIVISFGLGAGLSIGLYNIIKEDNEDHFI